MRESVHTPGFPIGVTLRSLSNSAKKVFGSMRCRPSSRTSSEMRKFTRNKVALGIHVNPLLAWNTEVAAQVIRAQGVKREGVPVHRECWDRIAGVGDTDAHAGDAPVPSHGGEGRGKEERNRQSRSFSHVGKSLMPVPIETLARTSTLFYIL